MEKSDWTPINNVAVTGSNAVYKPTEWLPTVAHRFYIHLAPAKAHLITFVSAILWEREDIEGIRFTEPLATAGCLDYGVGNPHKENYWYSWAQFHTWMPGRHDDGKSITSLASHWPKWKLPFQSVSTLAVPLIALGNAEDLSTRIVNPLLKLVDDAAIAVPLTSS